jgi:DNA-binding IclR family transcriptional regulator
MIWAVTNSGTSAGRIHVSAMGTKARLRIMQLLLEAHPEGLVVSEIQEELDIPNSNLSAYLTTLSDVRRALNIFR